jgi:tyrosyl-tRNA synthetase
VVITLPLLEGLDGVQKMSKSLGNYVGIDEPARDMFYKLMHISPELMMRYYELLTDITPDELANLKENLSQGKKDPRQAQEDLAKKIVSRYHGQDSAEHAVQEYIQVRDGGLPDEIEEKVIHVVGSGGVKVGGEGEALGITPLGDEKTEVNVLLGTGTLVHFLKSASLASSNSEAINLISAGRVKVNGKPTADAKMDLQPGDSFIVEKEEKKRNHLPDVLKDAGLVSSTSEARRLISQGAVKVNEEKVTDINKELSTGETYTLQVGKRRFKKVTLSAE